MGALVLAGEAIFSLPFHVARFFRPTLLQVLGLTNSQLGNAQAVYGVLGMISYFPGGPLADRFSARKLMTASLFATAAGGLWFAALPGLGGLSVLFGFWGVTSILLFWAAMIRATREWGSAEEQGLAFGALDGGRGLTAALLASGGVALFGLFFPEDATLVSDAERASALSRVILTYTAVTALTGVVIWLVIPEPAAGAAAAAPRRGIPWRDIGVLLRRPSLWLNALIIICAYVGYKGYDNISLFAVQGYGMDEVEGAQLSALGAWMRPVAALAAGLVADRLRASHTAVGCFALMLGSYLLLGLHTPTPGGPALLYTGVLASMAGVYGHRGVYYALLEEAAVPTALTGTATGLISFIGYTPDIFVSPIAGWLLDRSPGVAGHQHLFFMLAAFSGLGFVAASLFRQAARQQVKV